VRRAISLFLKTAISSLLIGLLLRRIGLATVLNEVSAARPEWLALGLCAFALSNLLGAVQWHWFLEARGLRLSLLLTIGFYHVGLFFNNFLIGYVGGDAFRIYDAARASGRTAEAASAVFMDRMTGFIVLTTMAVVASLIWLRRFELQSMFILGALVMILWVVTIATLFEERIARRVAPIVSVLLPSGLREKLRDVYWQLNAYRHNRGLLARAFALSIVIQFLRVAVHYLTGRAVGVEADIAFFLVFIPIIALAASLPITFGGIGVREQSGVALFGQVGIPGGPVTAMELLAYLVGIACSVPGGIYFLVRRERLRPQPEPGPAVHV